MRDATASGGPRDAVRGAPRPPLAHRLRWWAPAALALLVGYADLARGGVVLAPALLALAYTVLIPVAVLRR